MSGSRILFVIAALSVPSVVGAGLPRARPATSDSRIAAHVNAALRADRKLRGSGISVRSVSHGVVVLAGTSRTMSDHLRASGDAARVPGVHRVANEVAIRDLRADGETRGDRDDRAPDGVRDTWATSATAARVLADSPTPGLRLVDVDTRSGAVTLFGAVPATEVAQ